jgi:hypothetical protein
MAKRIIWCLIAAILVMAFHSREGMAEEIICISPTTTSGVTIPPDWHGDLAIYAEKWTISRGEGIALWCVCGEGPLCPEYQWSVSGNGFHFDSSAGPTTGETQKQFEIIELWADNKACGTATVTVIDDCGKTDTAYIRGTKGKWVEIDDAAPCSCEIEGALASYFGRYKSSIKSEYINGKYRWVQINRMYTTSGASGGCPHSRCNNFCANGPRDDSCVPCMAPAPGHPYPGSFDIPCHDGNPGWSCWRLQGIRKYEWSCR